MVELVYTADLKSAPRKGLRVRVPPPAIHNKMTYIRVCHFIVNIFWFVGFERAKESSFVGNLAIRRGER